MQKRLRYAMPRVPLGEHRQRTAAHDVGNGGNMPENVATAATNVGIMARRIGEAERKKRRTYRAPPERPLGGDVESSYSDESEKYNNSNESDDDEGLLVGNAESVENDDVTEQTAIQL